MSRRAPVLVLLLALAAFGIGDFERGNRHYRAGRYEEAVQAYSKALEAGADTPQLHYNLGTALLRLGRFGDAERHLRRALNGVDPEVRPRALYNLGTGYLQAARGAGDESARAPLLDQAEDALRRALRLNPANMDAKWNLELALREREKPPPGGAGGNQNDQGEQDQQPPEKAGGPEPRPGRQDERPAGPEYAPLTPEEADRILSAAEQDERNVYRQHLRQERRDQPVARDW